jgi:putative glutamine amidotransferase
MGSVIGITADTGKCNKPAHRKHEYLWIKRDLTSAVTKAGGVPFVIPLCETFKEATDVVKNIDGLIISGGYFDINPSIYGEKRKNGSLVTKNERTTSEMHLLKAAIKQKKPILGICGGQQLINVYFGGTLCQDILKENRSAKNHEQKTHFTKPSHIAIVAADTQLFRIIKTKEMKVNSTHHQSVKKLGKGLIVSAVSPDGIIEAIEKPGDNLLLGVQWHPEFLTGMKEHLALFKALVKSANSRRE